MNEIKNISNRPTELFTIPYYRDLPSLPVKIDISGTVGEFLQYDLFDLDGVQPIEQRHMKINKNIINVNPSKKSIDIYRSEKVNFQLVSVVVNAYGFKEKDGLLIGKPYNISLQPASKRGEVSVVGPDWLEKIDLEQQNQAPKIYRGFNPFIGAYGLYMMGYTDYTNIESDMIGFVINTYALAMPFKHSDVLYPSVPEPLQKNKQVRQDYGKYRKDWYFKPFKQVKPKRIWGCDSPIELFLLQAMDSIGLYPEIQTIINEDGFTVPSFHKLWENEKSRRRLRAITDADFYFPEVKLAIFCDSIAHHSSPEAIKKDIAIDEKLAAIGITSMRISGKDLAESPLSCAKRIQKQLIEMA